MVVGGSLPLFFPLHVRIFRNPLATDNLEEATFVNKSTQLPSDVIDFATLPAQRLRFWVSSDLKVAKESARR